MNIKWCGVFDEMTKFGFHRRFYFINIEDIIDRGRLDILASECIDLTHTSSPTLLHNQAKYFV